ncbi:hypothetical protein CNY67_15210 [Desulfovibrio sp. G11]|nr:hypothetical protein CNY67_15210 [Desulfovibrio sp. G11]
MPIPPARRCRAAKCLQDAFYVWQALHHKKCPGQPAYACPAPARQGNVLLPTCTCVALNGKTGKTAMPGAKDHT